MSSVYDCFLFNNEFDLLDIRLNYLNSIVDKFVIVESKFTFTGIEKGLLLKDYDFGQFDNKIIYIGLEDFKLNQQSEQWRLLGHVPVWEMEHDQRNYILSGLDGCSDNDFIVISDIDEIPYKEIIGFAMDCVKSHIVINQQDYRCYGVNCRLKEEKYGWLGSTFCSYKDVRTLTPQKLREHKKGLMYKHYLKLPGGWHFSYMLPINNIQTKLKSYSHFEFNKEPFINSDYIQDCVKNKKRIYDGAELELVSDRLPEYIEKNKEKFKHLFL